MDEDEELGERIGRIAAKIARFPFEGPIVAIGAGALRRAGVPLKEAIATAGLIEAGQASLAEEAERNFLEMFGLSPRR